MNVPLGGMERNEDDGTGFPVSLEPEPHVPTAPFVQTVFFGEIVRDTEAVLVILELFLASVPSIVLIVSLDEKSWMEGTDDFFGERMAIWKPVDSRGEVADTSLVEMDATATFRCSLENF